MKTWVKHSIFGLAIGLVVALVFWVTGCTAPVQIHVRAEQWQCPAEVHNDNGTVDFQGCKKMDGDSPSDQDATDGKDSVEVSLFESDHRLN